MNLDNSPMIIDPVWAKQLLAEGSVLIIAGVPVGTEFGIDLCSYTIGEQFRGVKMIPPGPHVIWCAAKGPFGDLAPKTAIVHFFQNKEIFVREWDNMNEELKERNINDPDLEKKRIRDNLLDLDRFLAPYDLRYLSNWKHLTDALSEKTVNRCKPILGIIRTNIELQSCSDENRPRGPLKTFNTQTFKQITHEDDLLPKLKPIEGTAPRFTTLPNRIPEGATASDISRHSMDCIEAIETLMGNFSNANELIEEIQISFVFFLLGHSVESLAHWRKLLSLLSHSETAVDKYKLFYMKFSEVLSFQLPLIPEELGEPTERNTVYKDIRCLLINLNLSNLSANADRLSKKLKKTFNWHFDGLLDEDPEDMPVIVEDS